MPLILEQRFSSGRFHATRWNQGVFGDPYGEWPPSPWRLLRALANRWFQWSREVGETDMDRLEILLTLLARTRIRFHLPPQGWRVPSLPQYFPYGLEWTDKTGGAAAVKRPQKSLNHDEFRVMSPSSVLYWEWADVGEFDTALLDALLVRVLYFGRAESSGPAASHRGHAERCVPSCLRAGSRAPEWCGSRPHG